LKWRLFGLNIGKFGGRNFGTGDRKVNSERVTCSSVTYYTYQAYFKRISWFRISCRKSTRTGERIRWCNNGGADKFLARPGRKQARKHVRDARDFNNIGTRTVIKFFFPPLQGKAAKEIQAILAETLACFLPGRAKDLSAPLYCQSRSCYKTSHVDKIKWKYMNSLLSFFIT